MKKICGIYKITNPIGCVYIGQSTNCYHRENRYKNLHCKGQVRVYRSILKYGWDSHKFEIIHECKECELNDLEIHYIKLYDSFSTIKGLNLESGGRNSSRKQSPETIKKKSDALKGRKLSKEHCIKISISNTGKIVSVESRKKMSEAKKGKPLSEKAMQKTIEYWTGRNHTKETKVKISNSNKGKKRTKEQRLRISEGTKEALKNPEIRKKISEGNKLRVVTEKTKLLMSISQKKRRENEIKND